MRFTETEKENIMLNDNHWANRYSGEDDADTRSYREVCPICNESKFKDNAICYTCMANIRGEFLGAINHFGSRHRELVIDEIKRFIETL